MEQSCTIMPTVQSADLQFCMCQLLSTLQSGSCRRTVPPSCKTGYSMCNPLHNRNRVASHGECWGVFKPECSVSAMVTALVWLCNKRSPSCNGRWQCTYLVSRFVKDLISSSTLRKSGLMLQYLLQGGIQSLKLCYCMTDVEVAVMLRQNE